MKWLALLLLWLGAAPGLAQAPAPAAPPPPAAPAPGEPLAPALWRAERAGVELMLFGTVHLLPRGVSWLRPHVVQAVDGAELVLLEAVLPEDPAGIANLQLRVARLPAPRALAGRVPAADRPALLAAIERYRTGPLDSYKTWFAALTLANAAAQAAGLDPRIGAEPVISARARLRNIPVEGLETPEQQLVYFDALSELDQQQLLAGTVRRLDDSQARTRALVDDWVSGRVEQLGQRLADEMASQPPMLRQLLLGDRNARWAQQIDRRLAGMQPGQRLFVAVGAGHMTGSDSLLRALARYGIEAQSVVAEAPPPAPPAPRRPARRR